MPRKLRVALFAANNEGAPSLVVAKNFVDFGGNITDIKRIKIQRTLAVMLPTPIAIPIVVSKVRVRVRLSGSCAVRKYSREKTLMWFSP